MPGRHVRRHPGLSLCRPECAGRDCVTGKRIEADGATPGVTDMPWAAPAAGRACQAWLREHQAFQRPEPLPGPQWGRDAMGAEGHQCFPLHFAECGRLTQCCRWTGLRSVLLLIDPRVKYSGALLLASVAMKYAFGDQRGNHRQRGRSWRSTTGGATGAGGVGPSKRTDCAGRWFYAESLGKRSPGWTRSTHSQQSVR